MDFASRLVAELMPVSVLVAGEGAGQAAAALVAAGTSAETFGEGQDRAAGGPGGEAQIQGGYDLVMLLAGLGDADLPETRDLVSRLSLAAERLLFAPLPLGGGAPAAAPNLAALTRWFELFAERGYQPMVEFDAGFVSAGAFLMDRSATAAESELAAFVERLQSQDAAPAVRQVSPEPPAAGPSLADSLAERDAELARLKAELDALAGAAAASARRAEELAACNRGWDALRVWIARHAADPARDTPAALAASLVRLNALRGLHGLPALAWQTSRPSLLRRLFRNSAAIAPPAAARWLEDTALVRAHRLFDAAWYVAANPETADDVPLDPVFHYVFVGGLRGADPGPWFDTASYVARFPQAGEPGVCPLVHAIRSGEAAAMLAALADAGQPA